MKEYIKDFKGDDAALFDEKVGELTCMLCTYLDDFVMSGSKINWFPLLQGGVLGVLATAAAMAKAEGNSDKDFKYFVECFCDELLRHSGNAGYVKV